LSQLNNYFDLHYHKIEEIAKKVLKSRFREGISSYFIYLHNQDKLPARPYPHVYYFMCNLSKPNSEINYIPVTFKTFDSEEAEEMMKNLPQNEDLEVELMMRIDLDDERLIDFLLHNDQNDKWIQIYKIMNEKRVELDLFEEIVFDYVFVQGLSIRDIAKITGNSASWCYRYRKSVIQKLRAAIKE
jgi:hypothetical protein